MKKLGNQESVLLTAQSINIYLVHAGTYEWQSHKEDLLGYLIFTVHKTYEVYLSVDVIAYNCDCIVNQEIITRN